MTDGIRAAVRTNAPRWSTRSRRGSRGGSNRPSEGKATIQAVTDAEFRNRRDLLAAGCRPGRGEGRRRPHADGRSFDNPRSTWPTSQAELVVDWFDDTLPGFLSEHPGPVSFLHVDSDLHSSATTVFDPGGLRRVLQLSGLAKQDVEQE